MMASLEAFHFLRPVWLLCLVPLAVLWIMARPRKAARDIDTADIAPHLAAALRVGGTGARRILPVDGVAVGLALLALAAAGPSWSRIPNPLVSETAPLVVALKVTESMETRDLAPSRLDRARFKILDLVDARAGARTALIAYAGSAHRVSPLTEDPNILRPLLDGLSPAVMPKPGDDPSAALALALEISATADTPGAILMVLDDFNPAAVANFKSPDDVPLPPIVMLVSLPNGQVPAQLDRVAGVTVVPLSADDSDLKRIERTLRSAYKAALLNDERLKWQDRGGWLLWPAAVLALLWYRRGWTMRWTMVVLLAGSLQLPSAGMAEGWQDWFLTPDQQARLAYEDKDYARAATLFEDPMWRGHAQMRAGQYADAAETFADLDTADAAFAEGLSRIRNRQYRPGARAFEKALERQPDFPAAATNRDIAWAIVAYVETAQEQSDTGEEHGIGADEIVYDNETQRGTDTSIEAPSENSAPQTAQQWIDSIDTDMGDFLRSRFLLEQTGAAR
ncbi:VWA domain-containing protein [Microbulbifer sp. S227A]|uniref:VWA domain-containing protein n=1 Tax=Microbulbifer sp. S227A TaxID=3415131 RepID=UPI003C7BA551